MARFDVYANPDAPGALLDVQADLLDQLNTRLVVPLMPPEQAPLPARFLNPTFQIDEVQLIMVTQFMATVPTTLLRQRIGNLSHSADEVTRAIDMLLLGF